MHPADAGHRHEWVSETSPGAGRSIRRQAVGLLSRWSVDDSVIEVVQILIEELVANVVDHARTAFRMVLSLDKGTVLLEVHDDSPEEPVLREPDRLAVRGRGLQLVQSLATAWGHEIIGDGKRVWAEIEGVPA